MSYHSIVKLSDKWINENLLLVSLLLPPTRVSVGSCRGQRDDAGVLPAVRAAAGSAGPQVDPHVDLPAIPGWLGGGGLREDFF